MASPYRAPGKISESPRERPKRLVIRDSDFYLAMPVSALFFACAVWATGCAYGTKVTCARPEATCTAAGLFTRHPVTFKATIGAVAVTEEHDEGKTRTNLTAGSREIGDVDPERARALLAAYDTFVRDERVMTFVARAGGGAFIYAYVLLLVVLGVLTMTHVATTTRATIDVLADSVRIERRARFRSTDRVTAGLSSIHELVSDVAGSEIEGNAWDLFALDASGKQQRLYRGGCGTRDRLKHELEEAIARAKLLHAPPGAGR